MTHTLGLLAAWLTPVVWLAMPALIVERGPEGLWMALVLALAPLIALGVRPPAVARAGPEPVFPAIVLLLVVGALLWANLLLAGEVALGSGVPRWQGVAIAAAGGWLLTVWPVPRLVPALVVVALAAAAVPLVALAHGAGLGPIAAWTRVATLPAFRFPAGSPWVSAGGDPRSMTAAAPVVFAEEYRVVAPAGGRLVVRAPDGGRASRHEWTLEPGQAITLRPGDRLDPASTARIRFEADARVPGAPSSGVAWAAGRPVHAARVAGFLCTVLLGAVALLGAGAPVPVSRGGVVALGGGAVLVLLWAQGWAVYSLLAGPDVFLGGVTPDRLVALPAALDASPLRLALQVSLLGAGLAGFLASSIGLRERLGALDSSAGGEIGRDLGLWTGMFAVAGLASLWPLAPWTLALWALGAAAAGLGPATLGRGGAGATLAGGAGLALFVALAVAGQFHARAEGGLETILTYPALAAVPAGLVVLLARRSLARR